MSEGKLKQELESDYPLIPMSDITDEARMIAVAWMECDDKNWIENKHKLASDIMNYARRKNQQTHSQLSLYKEKCRLMQEYFDAEKAQSEKGSPSNVVRRIVAQQALNEFNLENPEVK